MILLILAVSIEFAIIIIALIIFGSLIASLFCGSPYIGITKNILKQILFFGGLSGEDIFYDLGAGDGRVVVCAKKDFSVQKATGYEISPWPYLKGTIIIKMTKLSDPVSFERKNIFNTNLSDATFVYLYLYTSFINEKIAPKLSEELRVGTKILSCSSKIDLEKYKMFKLIKSGLIGSVHVYLYQKI